MEPFRASRASLGQPARSSAAYLNLVEEICHRPIPLSPRLPTGGPAGGGAPLLGKKSSSIASPTLNEWEGAHRFFFFACFTSRSNVADAAMTRSPLWTLAGPVRFTTPPRL